MTLTFDAPTHAYTLNGQPVRSVTQILRKVGLVDFRSVPPSILDSARTRGTIVHRAAHFYNEHDLDVAEFEATFPEYAGYLRSWIRLVDTGRLQPVACEQLVANVTPRYAGTFDWLGTLDHEAALLDFATGDPADASKHLQTAAYVLAARAWAEMSGEDVLRAFHAGTPYVKRYAVRLHPNGELPTLTPYTDPSDFSKWLVLAHAVNLVDTERPSSIPWDWLSDEELRAS